MALNDAALDVGGEAIAAAITHVSFHSGAPGAAGTTNLIAGGRFAINLDSTNGDLALASAVNATGLTASATVAYLGLWSAATAGTYYGDVPRQSGDATVNASGEYTIDSLTIPASSS
jgi:hypothetical protein